MAKTKNLCAQIPVELYAKITSERIVSGETTSEFITNLIFEHYNLKPDNSGIEKSNDDAVVININNEALDRIKQNIESETRHSAEQGTLLEMINDLLRLISN